MTLTSDAWELTLVVQVFVVSNIAFANGTRVRVKDSGETGTILGNGQSRTWYAVSLDGKGHYIYLHFQNLARLDVSIEPPAPPTEHFNDEDFKI